MACHTEGDCEGRTTTDLGIHTGSVVDIAQKLSGYCYYSLQFSRKGVEITKENPKPQREEVSVSFDIDSNTWDMTNSERVAVMKELLRESGVDPEIVQAGQYFASVKLKFNP